MRRFLIIFFLLLTISIDGYSYGIVPKEKIPFPYSYERKFRHVEDFYRHKLIGDFNGDGVEEMLYESLYSQVTSRPIDDVEYFGGYDELVTATCDLEPILKLKNTVGLKELELSIHCQVFGILRIINLGEVDGVKGDEIALIVDWADWSNLSSCKVYSYRSYDWIKLLTFDVHETTFYDNDPREGEIDEIIEKYEDGWVYKEFDVEYGYIWRKLKL